MFPLELAFGTEELRDMCEHEATAIARLGHLAAAALKNRLSDIRAAEFMCDVVAGHPRSGVISGLNCFHLELADRFVLAVVANHVPPRLDGNGQTDWSRVRRVKVVSVGAMQ